MWRMLQKIGTKANQCKTVNLLKMLGVFWCDSIVLFLSMNFVGDSIMSECQKVKFILKSLWLLLSYLSKAFLWLLFGTFHPLLAILLSPA